MQHEKWHDLFLIALSGQFSNDISSSQSFPRLWGAQQGTLSFLRQLKYALKGTLLLIFRVLSLIN